MPDLTRNLNDPVTRALPSTQAAISAMPVGQIESETTLRAISIQV
jgi:hypothetical protein